MLWVGAGLTQDQKLSNCTLWLCCRVDSRSRQQALSNMNDFLCCEPGLCPLALPALMLAFPPPSFSLHPFALLHTHSPQLGPESHNVSLDLLVSPPSLQASGMPSHHLLLPFPYSTIPWHCHPHTNSCWFLWPPCSPLGLILVAPG